MAAGSAVVCQTCEGSFASWSLLFAHKSTCTKQEHEKAPAEVRGLAASHEKRTSSALNDFLSSISEDREKHPPSLAQVFQDGSPLSTSVHFKAGREGDSEVSADTLAHLNWQRHLRNVKVSAEGSTGVFFAEFARNDDNFTVVVKGSVSLVQELMSATLALIMNIRVPAVRLVCADQQEWEELRHAMKLRLPNDPAQHIRLEKQMNRPFFLIMEYLPNARSLMIPADELQALFDPATPVGVRNLRDIGLVLCLDVVTNNPDRLPLIWNNEGQLENLIISQAGQIVAIDNSCNSPPALSPQRTAYLARIAALRDSLLDCKTERACEQVARVRSCLKNYGMTAELVAELGVPSGFDIGEQGCIEIAIGLLEGMARFSETLAEHVQQFVQLVHNAPEGYDWLDIYETGRKQCSAEFLNSIIDIFRERRDDILAILEGIEGVRLSSNSTIWQSASVWLK